MKVFCPNCGSENDGLPGGRVVCRACTATFEVPVERQSANVSPPVVATPVPAPQQQYSTPMATRPGNVQMTPGVPYNTLAIVSIISSFCCSPVGLITGIIGLNQIGKSNGAQKGKELAIIGIVISALGFCSGVLYVIAAAVAGNN